MRKNLFLFFLVAVLLAVPSLAQCCFSDFDCGIGYKCVKAPFGMYGKCMKPVDEFGLPRFHLPDPDSMQTPLEGECDFDTDCPIGFYCDRKYKVCVKRRLF
ncbi:MAG: hypothetical protein ACUVWN_04565 [bacterium]